MFCFWDKCIWIVGIELSLLRRKYVSSAVNVLRKHIKTFHVTKSDFSNSITFTMINQYTKGAGIKIESELLPVYHVACRGSSETGVFRDFSKHVFPGRYFRKYRSYEGHLFLKMLKI